VLDAVHRAAPPAHDPFIDLLPPEGIKLTPRHYAYLKISEGCNNRCTFCIIPRLRGDLVSRPAADVMREAEHLVAAGVKELLVISQDTSAYVTSNTRPAHGAVATCRPSSWTWRAPSGTSGSGCACTMCIPTRTSMLSSR
jgi:tRNA A37 methylthiotransferase MiaB